MNSNPENSIPKTAFVLFNNGAFGGAEKRFSVLFRHLYTAYPDRFYFFINRHLEKHIDRIYPEFPKTNIRIVDISAAIDEVLKAQDSKDLPTAYADIIPDPLEVDRNASFLRKVYWFRKNKYRQRKLFNIIEGYRKELGVEVFIGVFSGVLPLVFYMKEIPRRAAVIFSDMDSWFSDVHSDMKRLWYRKYYSFNYSLEHADAVDFLSPYIIEGVKKRNVNVSDERTFITACSGVDYSKCRVGDKSKFEIAFCARTEPDKNPMLYLEAAREILKEYPDVKFHLMGEGSLVNEIRDFIDSNSLQNSITFQFHKNPPEVFANTSVFVSMQSGTNYPSLSLIESMACGNAVIASDVGDTRLLLNESNSILVNLSKDDIVAALKKLIDDKALKKKLGDSGRDFVLKNHTIERESDYYLDIIKRAKAKLGGGKN